MARVVAVRQKRSDRRSARRVASDVLSVLGRHAGGGTVDALLPRPPGVKQESRRLCPAVEAIVAEEIQRFHRTRQRPALAELVERIHALSMGLASKRAPQRAAPKSGPG